MIERYQHPGITAFFNRDVRIKVWAQIELAWVVARAQCGENISEDQIRRITATTVPTAEQVDRHERNTGHDVVAFLDLWTDRMDDDIACLIHRGLTSSDIVDTAHFMALSGTADVVGMGLINLAETLDRRDTEKFHRLGRTHGQYAEPTTLEHRIQTWQWPIADITHKIRAVETICSTMKTPGATGSGWFFTPEEVGVVARILQVQNISMSTQVIPRSKQIGWAATLLEAVAVCEDIALEVRLSARSEVAEMKEGGVRVGSSAMPGKKNPISAENITGLARLARGYFTSIADSATLHNDRDISNSSVERVAVEDLAHVAALVVLRTTELVAGLQIDGERMLLNLQANKRVALASTYQFLVQKHLRMRSVDAGKHVESWYASGAGIDSLIGVDVQVEVAMEFMTDLALFEAQMGL